MDIQTRLVAARLNIEFQPICAELEAKAIEEYNTITQLHNNSIEKCLRSLQIKSSSCKCGGGTTVLGEMLVHIYKKLEHIENLIAGTENQYIPLKHITHTSQLGHGVILLESSLLQPEQPYYVRLFLPVFPVRCVPLFATAKENGVLKITKIGERDLKDYDGYIVGVEREMLKARKPQDF